MQEMVNIPTLKLLRQIVALKTLLKVIVIANQLQDQVHILNRLSIQHSCQKISQKDFNSLALQLKGSLITQIR